MKLPSLRDLYDSAERALTPPIEAVVQSDELAIATSLIGKARRGIGRRVDGVNAAVLHLANIPAGSDIRKLRRQVSELDYEIRQLRLEVGQQSRATRRSNNSEKER
ncbi:MAG: hypothetical protein QM662_07915 [Gordonia sp. (in: high G+C Gram-positive bacteria)]